MKIIMRRVSMIFYSENHGYDNAKGGIPQSEKQALTDTQTDQLINTVRVLPPYVLVMIGLHAELRREEILALRWDSVSPEAPLLRFLLTYAVYPIPSSA